MLIPQKRVVTGNTSQSEAQDANLYLCCWKGLQLTVPPYELYHLPLAGCSQSVRSERKTFGMITVQISLS